MFDIGWSELLIIGVVALIAIGPKELPGVLRTVGQWMGKVRRMASEFQGQFQEAMREAEMADLKKQVDEMTDAAYDFTNFDPLDSVQKDIDGAISGETKLPDAATVGDHGSRVAGGRSRRACRRRCRRDVVDPAAVGGCGQATATSPSRRQAPQPKAGSGT